MAKRRGRSKKAAPSRSAGQAQVVRAPRATPIDYHGVTRLALFRLERFLPWYEHFDFYAARLTERRMA